MTLWVPIARGTSFDDSPPIWEPLLWGGKIVLPTPTLERAQPRSSAPDSTASSRNSLDKARSALSPDTNSSPRPPVLAGLDPAIPRLYTHESFRRLALRNIPPLYMSPRLPGEGIWEWKGMPGSEDGAPPAIYRTTYRPSIQYPNAIVHMLLFDMKRVTMRLYVGSAEPGARNGSSRIEPEKKPYLLAITNALWKQKHSGDSGAVFRGELLRKMLHGMATLVTYKDESVDVLEWNDGIPASLVLDARQLKHLIVRDGKVVEFVVKGGQKEDSEVGLGFLLPEDQQMAYPDWWGYFQGGPRVNYGQDWFIATRSAFGIRADGNLVFAVGHHISTKDLGKALVLAGCQRAIHGDANPHNVLGNLYYVDAEGTIAKRAKLSPDQKDDSLRRYVDSSYASDFFAFFRRMN